GNAAALVFFLFDLLYLDGETLGAAPLRDRKERLRGLLSGASPALQFSDHQVGRGPEFYEKACELSLEGLEAHRCALCPRQSSSIAFGSIFSTRTINFSPDSLLAAERSRQACAGLHTQQGP